MNYQAGYFFHDPYDSMVSESGNGPTYQFVLNASTSIATKVLLQVFSNSLSLINRRKL
jgi:hypothetical protein